MTKVLFITTRLIYPVNDGRKVVLYNYCKGLAERHNCEVKLFTLLDEEESNIEQPGFISEVYRAELPTKIEKVKNILFKSLILNKWPLQVSLYYSKKTQKRLNNIIDEYNPDVVICDMARTAEYLKNLDKLKFNKILDMDDILSKRYRRQYENGSLGSDALGAYSKKLPYWINKTINKIDIMKFVLKKESKLLDKYEIDISKYSNKIIFVSPVESEEFNRKIGEEKSIDITIGVNYKYFSENIAQVKNDKNIVFLGNMQVAHNKDAIKSFLDNIFPFVSEKIPDVKLRIVGKCTKEYKLDMSKYENVEVTGEVDDIRKYVQECSVAIAPLTYGSGIKTKILETMAMGIPIVTNSIGVEGIKLEDDKNVIVRNDPKDFALSIIDLLENEEIRLKIAEESKVFIRENHQWENILVKFKNII